MKQLLEQIESLKIELGSSRLLFRGHSSSDYKLLPTIFRCDATESEIAIFYDYKAYVSSLNGKTKSNWNLLLDMQHYGLPTRLLDWTLNFGTALYFALLNNPESPCVWVLNPHKLNEISTNNSILYDISTMPDLGGHDGFNTHKVISNQCGFTIPYAIKPPHGNSRISAQRGLFTVHTESSTPIEESCPEAVRKIEIPKDKISELKLFLQQLGIDEFSLFPDHEGLANYLKRLHRVSKC